MIHYQCPTGRDSSPPWDLKGLNYNTSLCPTMDKEAFQCPSLRKQNSSTAWRNQVFLMSQPPNLSVGVRPTLSKSAPARKKEMIVESRRKFRPNTLVSIQGKDIETVDSYKYLGVHLNDKLDWTTNTDVLYMRGQSRLHLLRRLRSFGVCRTLLRTFYDCCSLCSLLRSCLLGRWMH